MISYILMLVGCSFERFDIFNSIYHTEAQGVRQDEKCDQAAGHPARQVAGKRLAAQAAVRAAVRLAKQQELGLRAVPGVR